MSRPAGLTLPFYPYSRYLREGFSRPVRKLCIDAGFTCPNKDPPRPHLA
jgi:radical SAM superfamily enzyme